MCSSDLIERDKKGGDGKGDNRDGTATSHQPDEVVIHEWEITLQQLDEKTTKPDGIQATGHHVSKPEHQIGRASCRERV